ncbi:hypothetical protein PT300_07165 [Enterobacteriaceae bacterium ESL0689]|nr:hypothetical protein [Enterobacteriaceae bacterium ESL0689]
MIKFLSKWLKEQLSFFIWTYIPIILAVIFGLFMVHYFPDIAMQAIGVFFILMLVAVFYFSR